jgi:hypothetical protein
MSKFIKLTNLVLNTNNIYSIVIKPDKYSIHIVGNHISGFNWNFLGIGAGSISSFTSEIEVCKNKHSLDYKIVSDWIDKN